MSHFTVLVIGDNIEKQLEPYQENNMNDCPAKYMEFNEVEEEYLEEWENGTRSEFYCNSNSSARQYVSLINYNKIFHMIIGESVELTITEEDKRCAMHGNWGKDKHYRCSSESLMQNTQKKEKSNVLPVPKLWIKCTAVIETTHPDPDCCSVGIVKIERIAEPKELKMKDVYSDFETFLKDWAGYSEKDPKTGKYGYWENPNAKWDWFQIGGRWRGSLPLKLTKIQTLFYDVHELGFTQAEIMNFVSMYKNEPEKFAEITKKYNGKKDTIRKFIHEIYESMENPIKQIPEHFLSESKKGWYPDAEPGNADQAKKGDIEWKKIHGNKEEYAKAIRFWEMKIEGAKPETEEEEKALKWDYYKNSYYTDRYGNKETYAKCTSNFTQWAYIKDGKWYEKGDMGWWGCSGESNEDALKWDLGFYKEIIEPLPDDTLLTIVDCHI